MRRAISLALLFVAATCASFAGVFISVLIDRPWNEVREPVLSDGSYVALFSALTALSLAATLGLLALVALRVRGVRR